MEMTLQEAKKKTRADGSVKILPGVWFETGTYVLKETEAWHDAGMPDDFGGGYTSADIILDEIYCNTDSGDFSCPTDDEIVAMLKQAEVSIHAPAWGATIIIRQ